MNTRKNGRADLDSPRPGLSVDPGTIVDQARQKTVETPQIIDLASLPDYAIIVIDGLRFDAKKVLDLMADEQHQYLVVATPHDEPLVNVNETNLAGRRTILLSELAVGGEVYIGTKCFQTRPLGNYLMDFWHNLQPDATPVDLGSLTADTIILMDNVKIQAGKLYKLLVRAENKGQILPVKQPKFDVRVIDTAEDLAISGQVNIEAFRASDVYWLNGQEFTADDIEQLILLNLRKVDPRSPRQRLTDSVTSWWTKQKADAVAFHKKHPKLVLAILVIVTGYMLFDTLRELGTPSNVATLNLLHYLQDPANGFTAYNEIFGNISTHKQLATINLAFMAGGAWLGYHDFRGGSKYSGTFGMIVGILVSRVVQFLVVLVIAAMMH